MLTHARKGEVAIAVHWTLIRKRPTVPGYNDVPLIGDQDYPLRKEQINRFCKQFYDYNIDVLQTDDAALRRVYDHLFSMKWNKGKLTNSYYHHLRVLWHNGLWWKQFWNFEKDFFYFKSRRSGKISLENPVLLQALRDEVKTHRHAEFEPLYPSKHHCPARPFGHLPSANIDRFSHAKKT